MCLIPVMYNVIALRCKVNMAIHINLLWRRSQARDQPSWSIWLHVSGMTTVCRPTSNSACSRLFILQGPALCSLSSLKLVLQTSGQKSSILLLNSSLSCIFFFLHYRHLRIFFSLSFQYRLPDICVYLF